MPTDARSWAMLLGRLAAALLLLAAMTQPTDRSAGAAQVRAVVGHAAAGTPVRQAVEMLTAQAAVRGERIDFQLLTDGSEQPVATTAVVLRRALLSLRAGGQSAVVLVSDGWWGEPASAMIRDSADLGIPLYWWPTGTRGDLPELLGVSAPARAGAAQNVAVSVAVGGATPGRHAVLLSGGGRPLAQAELDGAETTTVRIAIPEPGAAGHRAVLRLDATLIDRDSGAVLEHRSDAAAINVVAPPSLLVLSDAPSPLAASLEAGGWTVSQRRAGEMTALVEDLDAYDALVLENLPANAIPASVWRAIGETVQRRALGLLVLGGPDAFAAGAYRGSALEAMLPVISEPPERESPATVVFLVDVSGSMGREAAGGLRIARDAILETAAALRPVDRVGLVAFDVAARPLLAPLSRRDHVGALRDAFPGRASGGTAVMPALQAGLSMLGRRDGSQRLLILVTDGRFSAEDMAALDAALSDADAEVIALMVDDSETDAPSERTRLSAHATLLAVGDLMRLPALMRSELEARRPAISVERTMPVVLSMPPFGESWREWPAVDAYAVSRARPEARAYLATASGEPLFAAWNYGAGRVAVLTSGLGEWTTDWLTWDRWPELVAGLAEYVALRGSDDWQAETPPTAGGGTRIRLDTGAALTAAPDRIRIMTPDGIEQPVVRTTAPGIFELWMTSTTPGIYTLLWDDGVRTYRHSLLLRDADEGVGRNDRPADRLVEAGVLRHWTDQTWEELAGEQSWRAWLIAAALGLFLVTMIAERLSIAALLSLARTRLQPR